MRPVRICNMKMFEGKNMKLTDDIGDDHIATSAKTPLREDAFAIKDDEKIQSIEKDLVQKFNTLKDKIRSQFISEETLGLTADSIERDIQNIKDKSKNKYIITTEKDFVRLDAKILRKQLSIQKKEIH